MDLFVQVDNDNFWTHDLPKDIYERFEVIKNTLSRYDESQDTTIEIEARLGNKSEREMSGRFSPGVEGKAFKKILEHYNKKKVPPVETYDILFEEARVTVEITANGPVIKEVIKKAKEGFQPTTTFLHSAGAAYDVRVSVMIEYSIPDDQAIRERKIALDVVKSLTSSSSSLSSTSTYNFEDISKGCPCRLISQDDVKVVRGSEIFNQHKGSWLSLQWTLLKPNKLIPVASRSLTATEMNNYPLQSRVSIVNLPGFFSSQKIPASAFEFQLVVPLKNLEPLTSSNLEVQYEGVKYIRHKKRWSIPDIGSSLKVNLDFTETRGATDIQSIQHEQFKFEIEMEKAYRVGVDHINDPAEGIAFEFLKMICGIFLQSKIPPIPSLSLIRKELRFNCLPLTFGAKRNQQNNNNPQNKTAKKEGNEIEDDADPSNGARDFYNNLNRDLQDRHKSFIFHMRCLNNFIKSSLLEKYLKKITTAKVLELGCGKGGDLNKIQKSASTMVKYVGTDIAKQSLIDAVSRIQESKFGNSLKELKLICADLSVCNLAKTDWGVQDELEVWENGQWAHSRNILSPQETFNFITMQFAFHYMFGSEACVDRFFRGVSSRMESDSHFVITTVDSNAILSSIVKSGRKVNHEIEFRDEKDRLTCSIKFEDNSWQRLIDNNEEDNWTGIQYQFRLFDGDSVNAVDAPEWLVITSVLKKYCKKYGLVIVEQKRLGEFVKGLFEENPEKAEQLWKRMNVSNTNGTISDIEWEISNLYQVIVFRKLNSIDRIKADVGPEIWNSLSSEERNNKINEAMKQQFVGE